MPIDFNNIQTTRGREYDANMISRLNDSLQTVPIKQRAAILGSVIEESGGNPLAKSASNAYQGLLQWGKDRYRITSNDKEREFTKQIELIRKTLNDSTDHISWSHGGEGSGYKSFKEPLHIFHNPELPFEDVYRAFSYGYVRPKGKEESYSNRLKVAQQVYDRLNTQSNPTVTKQDIVDAVMAIPTAITKRIDKAVTFGKSMLPQTSQKISPNKKNNTMRWAEGGFIYQPKDAWDNLSMLEKSEMMKVAVRNGITDLKTIREKYNEFAKGGYLDWKEKASKYKHLDIDNDRTYDYEGWYNENPQRAWDFLNDNPDAHFDDKYKTVYHPTFSTQSKYSGKKDATYNPLGLVGGTWNKQGTVFTMSPDGYRGPVSMDERKWYLENAEDNGVQLREADGSLPVFDGIPWGGVLPNVTVTGNRFAKGGSIYIKDSKKGTFTAAATKHGMGVQEFASKVLAHPENYSPAMRKKANFARNFGGKKKSYGGYMEGGIYDIDIEELNRLISDGYEIELL